MSTIPTVDEHRPRWVVAEPGTAPLAARVIGWRATEHDAVEFSRTLTGPGEPAREVVKVTGLAAHQFPLDGERPTYWNSLHPDHTLVGSLVPLLEVYRDAQGLIHLVDDDTRGTPQLIGTLPPGLTVRPGDPDDLGIPESDRRWMTASDLDLVWMTQVETSSLAERLEAMPAVDGWHLVERLQGIGFAVGGTEPLSHWLANAIATLVADHRVTEAA